MLKIKQNVLTLKGLSLRASLDLLNPNENLAVIFEVQSPSNIQLIIQPKRGIIMQKQIKVLKIWVKQPQRDKALNTNFAGKCLKINCTLKAEYNRKIFVNYSLTQQKLNIRGWEQAKQSFETFEIPIVISDQAHTIRSDLRSQVSNSLNKSSRLGNSASRDEFHTGQSSSKGRFVSESSRKKISNKLDKQLDFLFQNQGNNKGKQFQYSPTKNRNYQESRAQIVDYYNNNRQIGQEVTYGTQNNIHSFQNRQTYDTQNNQRFLEILILAALAGFFAALGSNFRHLFKG